eukprot:SAG31_NODE_35191_length_325_cov_1.013274_1_plen_101_part_01
MQDFMQRDLPIAGYMMKHMSADLTKHLLVVVTHSLLYNEPTQSKYLDELHAQLTQVLPNLPRDRIMTANFANTGVELAQPAKELFDEQHEKDYSKVASAFM